MIGVSLTAPVLPASGGPVAGAQDTTRARADTAARDTSAQDTTAAARARARADSLARARQAALERERADSIKPPIARAPIPAPVAIGAPLAWSRDSIAATGALTLGELVERVPGVTVFRTGWIASPEMVAYQGAFGRVRVFYDGVELDALDPRTGGLLDFSFIEMWQLEDAVIETAANEIRIHLRSWSVRSTTPATRVDVYTGDLETNIYRGIFGRRFRRGEILQLGASQYGFTDLRNLGDADNTTLWGRGGWASPTWSVDGSIVRTGRDRLAQLREEPLDSLPRLDAASTLAYGRVAWSDPQRGTWAQAIASTQNFTIRKPPIVVDIDSIAPDGSPQPPDTTFASGDTSTTRPQYLLTGGFTRGPLRLSGAYRLRRINNRNRVTTNARLGYEQGRLALSVFGEHAPATNLLRLDVQGRLQLLQFLAVQGAVSRDAPVDADDTPANPTTLAVRGELGVRLGRMWATAGLMRRDTAALPAPVVFDTTFVAGGVGSTTATFATLRGKFYRDVGLDVVATRFENAGAYRPQYDVRSQLYVDSDMRARFPSGNLHILLAVTHEYRTQALFPTTGLGPLESSQYRTWGLLLEVRLLTATLTYQYRNFMDEEYQQVPGFFMPRPLNYYGVRWNFFN